MRLFVDTNIYLDILFKRPSLFESSSEFFIKSSKFNDELYVSTATFKDIAYFLKKIYHDNNEVNKHLITMYESITKLVGSNNDDAIESLYEDGDFEDNVQRNSAIRTMCDAVITRNIKDFKNKGINCFTPEEYLKYRH